MSSFDDVTNISVVVTCNGSSNWSVIAVPRVTGPQIVRLTHKGNAVIAYFNGTDGLWHVMRLADFRASAPVRVGRMACSPQRAGLNVRFYAMKVGQAIDSPLHGD